MQSVSGRTPFSRVKLGQIASAFLSIGVASFSLAALGEAQTQLTRKRKWLTDEEYLQGLGLAQLMPGAPTVNLTSYLGYRLGGLPGAATGTLSFLVPCFFSMLLLAYLYLDRGRMPVVANLFHGLAALVVGLVANTVLNLWESGVRTAFNWFMALAGFAFVFWFRMGVLRILLFAAGASILAALLTHRFPALSRWTEDRTADAPVPGPERGDGLSASHTLPVRSGRKHWAVLLASLLGILAIDLLVIHSRPELAQMGTKFLRIGALVFGSGYAMLPFIQDAVVNQFQWLTNEQFAVALALSLITPGPVTNIAVFIGYKVAGVPGALAGAVNMYFPAWAMTAIVADPYVRAGKVAWIRQVTRGIVAAFIGTLIVVLIRLASDSLVSVPAVTLAAGAFAAQRFGRIATVWIILAGALVSLVLSSFLGGRS
jgi:chromate transporter